MSDLFETQNEVTQDDCDTYAQNLVKGSVTPMPWQGFHSYTLRSNSGLIIQFRSKASPLDSSTTKLAKQVHGHLAPATTYHGLMPNSSVSVWVMEFIAGVGYLFTASTITTAKLDITVTDFAKFYAASWKNPQSPAKDKLHLYTTKLKQLSTSLPPRFTRILENTQKNMGLIIDLVPWVLTHQDLSDATIEPFGMALWGLESVLGCSGPNGWSYFGSDPSYSHFGCNPSRSRALFWKTLLREIECTIPDECRHAVNEVRTLGVLLRYGFRWENGTVSPVKDTTYLDVFLKDELKLAEESHGSEGTD
ncbi:hypothetical protein, variant [Exophiala oligosperma]|uniref:Aminoglycoside phosphotransferase domain-containing protein n=1 Tax=Exophiala oligosperma TaxID=215243 RepID=A0A0D2ADB0_9EURO|nr:hypothetical protein, variant [Exophiala oligosperma]KIW38196.1 hypothetical protein, variant [Exophiala oligosperma]